MSASNSCRFRVLERFLEGSSGISAGGEDEVENGTILVGPILHSRGNQNGLYRISIIALCYGLIAPLLNGSFMNNTGDSKMKNKAKLLSHFNHHGVIARLWRFEITIIQKQNDQKHWYSLFPPQDISSSQDTIFLETKDDVLSDTINSTAKGGANNASYPNFENKNGISQPQMTHYSPKKNEFLVPGKNNGIKMAVVSGNSYSNEIQSIEEYNIRKKSRTKVVKKGDQIKETKDLSRNSSTAQLGLVQNPDESDNERSDIALERNPNNSIIDSNMIFLNDTPRSTYSNGTNCNDTISDRNDSNDNINKINIDKINYNRTTSNSSMSGTTDDNYNINNLKSLSFREVSDRDTITSSSNNIGRLYSYPGLNTSNYSNFNSLNNSYASHKTPLTSSVNKTSEKSQEPLHSRLSSLGSSFFSPRKYLQNDKLERWSSLQERAQGYGLHLLIHCGNQVFATPLDCLSESKSFSTLLKTKLHPKQISEIRTKLEIHFLRIYCRYWIQTPLEKLLSSVPSIMMWNDEDVLRGFGSSTESIQESAIIKNIFEEACRFFCLFQLGINPEEIPFHCTRLDGSPGLSQQYIFNDSIAILSLDERSERSRDRILSYKTYKTIEKLFSQWKTNKPSIKHLYLISPVPLFLDYKSIWFRKFINWKQIKNYRRDSWSHEQHVMERSQLLSILFDYAYEAQVRITILSGSTKAGGAAVIHALNYDEQPSNAGIINQIFASPIAGKLESPFSIWYSKGRAKGVDDLSYGKKNIKGGLHIWDDGKIFLNKRNYVLLNHNTEKEDVVTINWCVKGSNQNKWVLNIKPYSKDIADFNYA